MRTEEEQIDMFPEPRRRSRAGAFAPTPAGSPRAPSNLLGGLEATEYATSLDMIELGDRGHRESFTARSATGWISASFPFVRCPRTQ